MGEIRLVCFDLGGVLVRLNIGAVAELVSLCPDSNRAALKLLLKDNFVHNQTDFSLNERFQRGETTTEEYLQQVLRLFEGAASQTVITEKLLEIIAGEYQESVSLLPTLAKRVRLGCFSNTHALHWEHLHKQFSWMDQFEIKLASHLCGVAKPDSEAFLAISRAANLEPEQCLFIDDRKVNIEGAERVGMRGVWCETPQLLSKDFARMGLI